jgi:hypothetical protein
MDLRDIEMAAREQGWRVERTRRGHPVFYHPSRDIGPIYGSGSPGDQRSIRNLLARLQAAGLRFPWTPRERRS